MMTYDDLYMLYVFIFAFARDARNARGEHLHGHIMDIMAQLAIQDAKFISFARCKMMSVPQFFVIAKIG